MRPKGKLFALLAIFAAIGLVTATGAFTSVEATRTAEVNVAGDAAALLALQPTDTLNGQNYASTTNDELTINLDGVDGTGVNLNATTDIQAVFNITNQGSQEVDVNISDAGQNDHLVTFYNASGDAGGDLSQGGLETVADSGQSNGQAATLTPGQTTTISIYIDTEGAQLGDGDELISNITVTAQSNSQ